MLTLYGMPVREDEACSQPNIQVSAAFARIQAPALVAETNAWMREFFGVRETAYMLTDPLSGSECLFLSPRVLRQLRLVGAANWQAEDQP